MSTWWWFALALAGGPADDGEAPGELVALPARYLVADPTFPGAAARSASWAALDTPPPAGVPWWPEADVRVDGPPDGSVVWPATQALDALNADLWHEAGITGAGVHVAVFDVGWSAAGQDPWVLDEVGTADCFAHPACAAPMDTLRPSTGEDGEHGYVCATVVRSVAPGAQLSLVRVNGVVAFENAVDWAIREGVDIISMSLSFFNSSFYDGTGPFADAVRRLVAHDILLVTSAGNSARQHLDGPWLDADGDGRMDFGGDNAVWLDLSGGGRRTVFVQWNEHGRCGESDLDVLVYDPDGFVVGRSLNAQVRGADRCDPVERVGIQADRDGVYRLEVVGRRVASAGLWVDIMAQSGQILDGNASASIADPGNQRGTFTVGAVRGAAYLDAPVEGYSSLGPVRSGVPKPDIAGPTGLDSPVYGAEGFFGTSASTPAVAGAVALVLEREPDLTPLQAADRLRAWAWREGADAGLDDPRWGAGKARLPTPSPARSGAPGCARPAVQADGLGAVAWLLAAWTRRRATGAAETHGASRPVRSGTGG